MCVRLWGISLSRRGKFQSLCNIVPLDGKCLEPPFFFIFPQLLRGEGGSKIWTIWNQVPSRQSIRLLWRWNCRWGELLCRLIGVFKNSHSCINQDGDGHYNNVVDVFHVQTESPCKFKLVPLDTHVTSRRSQFSREGTLFWDTCLIGVRIMTDSLPKGSSRGAGWDCPTKALLQLRRAQCFVFKTIFQMTTIFQMMTRGKHSQSRRWNLLGGYCFGPRKPKINHRQSVKALYTQITAIVMLRFLTASKSIPTVCRNAADDRVNQILFLFWIKILKDRPLATNVCSHNHEVTLQPSLREIQLCLIGLIQSQWPTR